MQRWAYTFLLISFTSGLIGLNGTGGAAMKVVFALFAASFLLFLILDLLLKTTLRDARKNPKYEMRAEASK